MKKNKLYAAAGVTFASLILWACAFTPNARPATPQVAELTPQPSASVSVPKSNAEDAAWAKVLEAAKKEGKVTIYSYDLAGDIGLAVTRAFKDRFGITVEIVMGRGAEFAERVKTEKRTGQRVGDLHDGSSGNALNMKKEGLTIPLAGNLPVLNEQGVWRSEVFSQDGKDKNVAAFAVGYYSPLINTKLVTGDKLPRVWRDLLKPQWKGRMSVTTPITSSATTEYFMTLMRGGAVDEDFLKDLAKQDLSFSFTGTDELRILARGEKELGIRMATATYASFILEGVPLKPLDLQDGIVITGSPTFVIFAGGPHPNAALVYGNWFLSKEGQEVYAKAAATIPIRSDIPDFLPEGARFKPQKPITMTSEDSEKAVQLFREGWLSKLWGIR